MNTIMVIKFLLLLAMGAIIATVIQMYIDEAIYLFFIAEDDEEDEES